MVPYLYTARDQHNASTAEDYLALHAAFIAHKQAAGQRCALHESPAPLVAYVSANSWVVDCECGAGNATDPAWGVACCYGCGAIHRGIVFPATVADVEAALLRRPKVATRHWQPGETVESLRAENVSHGIDEGQG